VASFHFAATELGNSVPLDDTIMPAVLMRDRLQWERPTLNMSCIQGSFLRLISVIPIKSILILAIKSAEGLTSLWHTWKKFHEDHQHLTIILVVASQFRRQLAEVEVKDAFVGGIGLMRYAITSLADLVAGIEPDVSPPPPCTRILQQWDLVSNTRFGLKHSEVSRMSIPGSRAALTLGNNRPIVYPPFPLS
jgi:hypothetical protein